MSATLDKIMAEVRQLSPAEREQLRELLNREPAELPASVARERARRLERSRAVRGKYAQLGASSQDFAARKREAGDARS